MDYRGAAPRRRTGRPLAPAALLACGISLPATFCSPACCRRPAISFLTQSTIVQVRRISCNIFAATVKRRFCAPSLACTGARAVACLCL